MKVYLAGPDVFLPDAAAVGRLKREICSKHGLTGLFPLDNEVPPNSKSPSFDIFTANTALMEEAEAVIANLTPFRGPSADVGTVYELGFMAGNKKLCAGYSNIATVYREKVVADGWATGGDTIDVNGLLIENFGLTDNLMIVHALDVFGIPLVLPKQPVDDPSHDLAAFEACVRLLVAHSAQAPIVKRA
jgi:nucleoside 2-deoxyribosyltransferase